MSDRDLRQFERTGTAGQLMAARLRSGLCPACGEAPVGPRDCCCPECLALVRRAPRWLGVLKGGRCVDCPSSKGVAR